MRRRDTLGSGPDPHVRFFDRIARAYGIFFPRQERGYRKLLRENRSLLALSRGDRVLDMGCGTGALLSALAAEGCEAWGVDPSRAMIGQARHQLSGRGVRLSVANPLDGLSFRCESFDLVLSSMVLHGLPSASRRRFLREALRVSRGRVLVHDYPQRTGQPRIRGIFTRFVELIEGGDYYRFVRRGMDDMRAAAGTVSVARVDGEASWYFCGESVR